MWVAYIDESGFTKDWTKDLSNQPFFINSALLVESSYIPFLRSDIDQKLSSINPNPFGDKRIGRNAEFKGAKIIKNFLKNPNYANSKVESIKVIIDSCNYFYGFDVCRSINIIIDKNRHKNKGYPTVFNPYDLAFYFLLERIEYFMRNKNDNCILICDNNPLIGKEKTKLIEIVFETGNFFDRYGGYSGAGIQIMREFNKILEISFTESHLSPGVVIADLIASIHNYHKDTQRMESSGLGEYHQKIIEMSPKIPKEFGGYTKGYHRWP